MKRKYIVQPHEGFAGVEFLADPPHHRRLYNAGEEVELDDKVHNVTELVKLGIIVPAPQAPAITTPAPSSEVVDSETAATSNKTEIVEPSP